MVRPNAKIIYCLMTICLLTCLPLSVNAERGLSIGQITISTQQGEDILLYKESHALVIGISNYTNGWPALPGVRRDVEEVKAALEAQGFHVVVKMDLNKGGIDQVFSDFISQYGGDPENRLLFYFAGHGHTVKTSYGEELGYIVPVDAPNPHVNLSDFQRKAIEMQQIEIYAKRIQSKHALFLFDACFSGSLFALSRAVPEFITYKTAQPVRQFITSGSADETVPDESVFRAQFVRALQGEADTDQDGYLTGTELGEFLQKTVVNYSRNAQHPQYGKIRNPNLDKGDFVFRLSIQIEITVPPGEATPSESRFSLDDLEVMAEHLKNMEAAGLKVQEYEQRDIPAEFKKIAWERFLQTFPDDNPYSTRDDELRNIAQERIIFWEKSMMLSPTPVPTRVPPTPIPAMIEPIKVFRTIFEEAFNDNANNWYQVDNDQCTVQVERGRYVFDHKRETGSWLSWRPIKLDSQQDFRIEITAHKLAGIDNHGYGIVWGLKDTNNYYEFVISGNGYYRYGSWNAATWSDIIAWTPSDSINQGDATNTVTIEKIGPHVRFYVNDQYLAEAPFEGFFDRKIGFVVYQNMKIAFEHILVESITTEKEPTKRFQTLFEEDFHDNSNDWSQIDTEQCTIKVERGKYVLDHKRETSGWFTWKPLMIDSQKDFQIMANIRKIEGVDNYGYGILWGLKDVNNYYEFVVSENGYYRYGKTDAETWSEMIPWTFSEHINQGNTINTLMIEKIGNRVRLYVNDHYLAEARFEGFFDNNAGFVVYRKMKIEIEYFLVKN